MKPGKLIQTSCANGRVARHATSMSSTTAAAALLCPVVAGAAESNAGEFRRTLSTFGTVARLKAGNKGQFIKTSCVRIRSHRCAYADVLDLAGEAQLVSYSV